MPANFEQHPKQRIDLFRRIFREFIRKNLDISGVRLCEQRLSSLRQAIVEPPGIRCSPLAHDQPALNQPVEIAGYHAGRQDHRARNRAGVTLPFRNPAQNPDAARTNVISLCETGMDRP